MARSLDIWVEGTPIPQGSKTGYVRAGRAVLVDASKRLKSWRSTVRAAAEEAIHCTDWEALDEPAGARLVFVLPRPKRPRFSRPAVKPDLDKLTRAVFDALTDAGVWADDSRVVSMRVDKVYAGEGMGDAPGVWIEVYPA